ncbi:hypothetical protein [Synechococcus sp. W70.1]|uniref:hypothetical protein n=1 Tax=Synechococcus sp. W70.1 TaxID=2964534 RepID=UPI0039C01E6C
MALQMLPIARDDPKKQQHYFAIALKECNRQIDLITTCWTCSGSQPRSICSSRKRSSCRTICGIWWRQPSL